MLNDRENRSSGAPRRRPSQALSLGLKHAPLNEQEAVYVFALVARELNFNMEAIGTSFPDCEAKRRIDRKGERWQKVRIEFEYLSSEF